MAIFGNEWDTLLAGEMQKPYYQALRQFLIREYRTAQVYPPMNDLFSALRLTTYSRVRVVILGQDPYHGAGQAHGLSFSVRQGVQPPPSLQNIYKEIHSDLGIENPRDFGDLTCWARQGVLLLNTVLTVRDGEPQSHRGHGWEQFTDRIIALLNLREDPIVFLLWGAPAGKKAELVTNPCHLILKAPHPSPLSASRGFFGCRHFSQTNQFLRTHGFDEIDWRVIP
ncbi:MAG: uracil-DNA glycosylase [Oscillospiraceae bacterium]|nr:uracil-DNA glycosylase [Oscillospiraceae bacterium]